MDLPLPARVNDHSLGYLFEYFRCGIRWIYGNAVPGCAKNKMVRALRSQSPIQGTASKKSKG